MNHSVRRTISLLLLALMLAGCASRAAVTPTAPANAPAQPATSLPPTPEPSPTPGKPAAVVVGPPDAAGGLPAVRELAEKSGLTVETQAELPGALRPEWKVVIFSAPPLNLDAVLQQAAAVQTQVVVISAAEIAQKAPNLTVIASNRAQAAFLAGYLAELLTGQLSPVALLPADGPDFAQLQDAYLNGARYWCGQCRLVPNFEQIGPLVVAQAAGADAATWQAGIAAAAKFGLDVVYLPAESMTPAVISTLAGQNVRIIGETAPPPELDAQWAATVRPDVNETLRALWPDLLQGKGGQHVPAKMTLSDVRSAHVPEARLRLVEETAQKLEQGLLQPLSVP